MVITCHGYDEVGCFHQPQTLLKSSSAVYCNIYIYLIWFAERAESSVGGSSLMSTRRRF
jgi:hypothetical protein